MAKRTKPGSEWREACGARLRQAREAVPLTQTELAAALEVTQTSVSMWERGEAAPRDALRPRIARVVGRPAAELFAFDDQETERTWIDVTDPAWLDEILAAVVALKADLIRGGFTAESGAHRLVSACCVMEVAVKAMLEGQLEWAYERSS